MSRLLLLVVALLVGCVCIQARPSLDEPKQPSLLEVLGKIQKKASPKAPARLKHVRFIARAVPVAQQPQPYPMAAAYPLPNPYSFAAAEPAKPAASTPASTSAATAGSDEDAGDWITNKNGTLKYGKILKMFIIVLVCVFFCFVFRKYIPTVISWIEQGCYTLYMAIATPIRWIVMGCAIVFYPIKQQCIEWYHACNHYYHPYLVVS